jgi:hypothetical protein
MAFCSHCGSDVSIARFCPNCGTPVGEAGADAARPAPMQSTLPPQAVQKRPMSCFAVGCLSIVGVVIVLFLIGVIGAATNPHTASLGTTIEKAGTIPHHTVAAPNKPHVVLDVQGSGTKTTSKFSVGDDWDLAWTYDCSNFGTSGNFIVSIDGDINMNQGVNQLGGSGHDVEHFHEGGTFYLTINSECDWHVRAISM